jgi:hypothetical protein
MLSDEVKLQSIAEKVDSELKKAIDERKEIGLSLSADYTLVICMYSPGGAYASIRKNEDSKILRVNVLPIAAENMDGEKRDTAFFIMKYMNMLMHTVRGIREADVYRVIESPCETFSEIEKSEGFSEYLKELEAQGSDYKSSKQEIIGASADAKDAITQMLPEIERAFLASENLHIRHELDHLSFISSGIYAKCEKARKSLDALLLENNPDDKTRRRARERKNDFLRALSEEMPILETRAMFFDFIAPGKWGEADFEKTKKQVNAYFNSGYIETGKVPQMVMDALAAESEFSGRINRATKAYVVNMAEYASGKNNPTINNLDFESVDYRKAQKLLSRELPKWKIRFSENAKTASDAAGNAFKSNPHLLSIAESANGIEEYARICNGK